MTTHSMGHNFNDVLFLVQSPSPSVITCGSIYMHMYFSITKFDSEMCQTSWRPITCG